MITSRIIPFGLQHISESKVRKYITKYDMWQHSVAGHKYYDVQGVSAVPGIAGQCDCNWAYKGFAAQIRKNGKNILPKKVTVTASVVVDVEDEPALTAKLKKLGCTVKVE